MRSILFLPLDKPERISKAIGSGADKVIFDLEDGLAREKKDIGRENQFSRGQRWNLSIYNPSTINVVRIPDSGAWLCRLKKGSLPAK